MESLPQVTKAEVVNFWFERQGLTQPRGRTDWARGRFTDLLERTGGLQLDSINVVERAHLLTLWSRFGEFDREQLDRWVYADRVAFDYWAHEASLMPASHLPIAMARMSRFPTPRVKRSAYWPRYRTSAASKRRVLARLRAEGPLESVHFERREPARKSADGWSSLVAKEDSRSLRLLWHAGKVAVTGRRHFRKVYDLADRVYPEVAVHHPDTETVDKRAYDESWVLRGLSGCGIATERHLCNYMTGPNPLATERRAAIKRLLRAGRIVEVSVSDSTARWFALPGADEVARTAHRAQGTTLICPFDSLLWQRERARDLLDFTYTVEIYVPAKKRKFGYYVLPILHDGRLVGRLDPKLHRDSMRLEVRGLFLEEGARRTKKLERGIAGSLRSLARFVGAESLALPKGWARIVA